MKHLTVLVAANLVIVRREGRTRWNYLNPVPIQRVCDRWVSKHVTKMAAAMSRLKDHVEERESNQPQPNLRAKQKAKTKSIPTTKTQNKARTKR